MKGLVRTYEIIDEAQEEILSESNLIVDGAGEHIVDILTTSFITSGDYENSYLSSFSGILDCSNFVVQAASFGNSYKAYGSNLLAYKKHNFAPNSSSLSGTGWTVANVSSDGSGLFKVTDSAATARVQLTSVGEYVSSSLSSIVPITASVEVKFNFDDPIEINTGTSKRHTSFQMLHWGASSTVNVEWSNAGVPSFTDSYQDGFIKDLLGGWYRISLRTKTDLSGTIPFVTKAQEQLKFAIYPAGLGAILEGTDSNAGGSLYIRNPSVNLGSVPIDYYVETGDAYYGYDDDVKEYPLLASSIVAASACGIFVINSSGTVTNDATGYNEIFELPEDPNPVDTKLQTNTETPYSEQTALKANLGHNINFALWEGKDVSATEFLDYLEEDWSYGSSIPAARVHEDIRFYSSYAPSSASGFDYHLITGMDSYDSPVATFTPAAGLYTVNAQPDNEDVKQPVNHEGFVRVVHASSNIGGDFSFPSDLSGEAGFLSATYETSPSAGVLLFDFKATPLDARWMSMTGGVQTLGLYVLDFKQMMNKGYTFPFDFENKDQPPIYKLFAKKVFHYPFAHVGDLGSNSGWVVLPRTKGYTWRIDL